MRHPPFVVPSTTASPLACLSPSAQYASRRISDASRSPTPGPKLRNDFSLTCGHVAVNGGDPLGDVEEIAQIAGLGVQTFPNIAGVQVDNVGEVIVHHLMLIADEPNEVLH